jgi:hypothetical protein
MGVASLGIPTRLLKHQFGEQSALGTAVPATRAIPFTGVPDIDLAYQEATGDFGSIDEVARPFRQAPELTAPLTLDQLDYNTIPLIMQGLIKGGVTASGAGTAKTWTHQAASLSADDFGIFTYQHGAAGESNYWDQLIDGVIESANFTLPDNLGPVSVSTQWRFLDFGMTDSTDKPVSGTVPTAGLTVDNDPVRVFLADAELFIDDTYTGIGSTKISDALLSGSLNITQETDVKRTANGSNTRFAASGYARGARTITLELQFEPTDDIIGTGSEVDKWSSNTIVDRFVELRFTSPEIITGSTPYSWSLRGPMRYRTRQRTTHNSNVTVTLNGRWFYQDDLGYPFRSVAVNTLASL